MFEDFYESLRNGIYGRQEQRALWDRPKVTKSTNQPRIRATATATHIAVGLLFAGTVATLEAFAQPYVHDVAQHFVAPGFPVESYDQAYSNRDALLDESFSHLDRMIALAGDAPVSAELVAAAERALQRIADREPESEAQWAERLARKASKLA